MNGPNYKDFYQKALIPIGSNDLIHFKELTAYEHANHSHWLIALVGELKDIEKEFYSWKVTIYPSDMSGSFSWNNTCYTSLNFDCFHQAYNHAKNIEKYGKEDQLYPLNIRENVS
ncbi:hypothetical protein ACFYKT_16890 [Cytobacillus sp. FJAT-53684]|uniref:Uncharacterized protein n=1 Tax=Cytobacillus mangrovibacter TaxID=3299024 RepID=A0ABW6K1H1_9BACI